MRYVTHRYTERGDTLVEVLLAITLMSVAITATYSIMTRMFATGMVAQERSQTQALMNGQAALIRDAQRRGDDDWTAIVDHAVDRTSLSEVSGDGCTATTYGGQNSPSTRWFYMDPAGATGVAGFKTFKGDNSSNSLLPSMPRKASFPRIGDGLWAETVKYTTSGQVYYDIYIKACWDSSYSNIRQQMKTIVRLYEPPK